MESISSPNTNSVMAKGEQSPIRDSISWLVYIIVRIFFGILNMIPLSLRLPLLTRVIRFIFFFLPKYQKVSRINLRLAFPDHTEEQLDEIISGTYSSIARLLVDFGRLHTLDSEWFDTNVSVPNLELMERLKAEYPDVGTLLATGHLGSFELMAYSAGYYGYPMSYVVRNFKMKKLDEWWKSVRERDGNTVVDRKGAFKKVVTDLRNRRNVGILFDQNVRSSFAVFVDWFGRKAATTKALGLAALRTGAPIVVAGITFDPDKGYTIHLEDCNCKDIVDSDRSQEEKVLLITERATRLYEEMIYRSPKEWFWMHRRWKTAPFGVSEDFYDKVG